MTGQAALDAELGREYARLAAMALQLGDLAKARDALTAALRHDPTLPEALYNLGLIELQAGELAAAEGHFRAALAQRPRFVDAELNLGGTVRQAGRNAEAVEIYRALAIRAPKDGRVWRSLSAALLEAWRLDEAETAARRALDLAPADREVHHGLALILARKHRWDAAIAAYRTAVRLDPDHVPSHAGLGLCLLTLGRFEEGWREFEWRWRDGVTRAAPPGRRWAGEPLQGKRLLLAGEQGFGDCIQFVRFAAPLAAQGAEVVLGVYAKVARLLQTAPGVSGVVSTPEQLAACDFVLPMLSAPLMLGVTLDTLPAETPYLFADAAERQRWAGRLEGAAGLKVGLVWAGDARAHDPLAAVVDKRRSLPVAKLEPLLALPGVTFVSLQKGEPAGQIGGLPEALRPLDFMAEVDDFADTAALIANLDLVVSVDTSVAHLAGALGKPVWMLSRHDACWRWLEGREDSPWYPTLKIYRQPRPGDWDAVIARLVEDLRARQAEV